jgi:alkylation response protein AidB-like acyl-CoA dehydrogenase
MTDRIETEADNAYRLAAREWLAEHGAEYVQRREFSEDELVARARAWVRLKWESGYSGIAVAKDAGGAGGTRKQAGIFAEEESAYHIPFFIGQSIGFAMAMDVIRKHGTQEQYNHFALPTFRGDASWCQLFSEPAAGSDLAAVRTRAVRQGDAWLVNGQKVWSSWAHHAKYGILLARTDASVPKHKGLTFFICDMDAPGVLVRPIRQITGKSDFNETFLTDVVIPDSFRIGKEGEGWSAAMTVLSTERNQSGHSRTEGHAPGAISTLIARANAARRPEGMAIDNPAVRQQLAQFYIQEMGLKHFGSRVVAKLARGEAPPPTLALMKLVSATQLQQTHAFLMDLDEYAGLFELTERPDREETFYQYLWAAAMRIAGGADEVLRNQLAERALGMPGDMRADKDVPFDQLPS